MSRILCVDLIRRFQPFEERVAENVSRHHVAAGEGDAVTPFHGEAQAVGGEFPVRDHAGNEVKAGVRRLDFAQSGLRSCPIRAAPGTAQWR
jgi:hypothetical protein